MKREIRGSGGKRVSVSGREVVKVEPRSGHCAKGRYAEQRWGGVPVNWLQRLLRGNVDGGAAN